jgi:hypothetical protein
MVISRKLVGIDVVLLTVMSVDFDWRSLDFSI